MRIIEILPIPLQTGNKLEIFLFYLIYKYIFVMYFCNFTASNSSMECTTQAINLDENVWSKLSSEIINICNDGKELNYSQRRVVIQKIVEYMIEVLKDTTRGRATEIAKMVCSTYPKTFVDLIGENETWGTGHDSLLLEIYNACLYRNSKNKRKRTFPSQEDDSDDEEQQAREKEIARTKTQDEYGCVEYAPILSPDETYETQENKRLLMLNAFSQNEDLDISKLMMETYPTLRAILNDKQRDLEKIVMEWPFIQDKKHFLEHCSRLLGKNVLQEWRNTLSQRIDPTRQYLKISKIENEKRKGQEDTTNGTANDKRIEILTEYKKASCMTKDKKPKQIVVFSLLVMYFQE